MAFTTFKTAGWKIVLECAKENIWISRIQEDLQSNYEQSKVVVSTI